MPSGKSLNLFSVFATLVESKRKIYVCFDSNIIYFHDSIVNSEGNVQLQSLARTLSLLCLFHFIFMIILCFVEFLDSLNMAKAQFSDFRFDEIWTTTRIMHKYVNTEYGWGWGWEHWSRSESGIVIQNHNGREMSTILFWFSWLPLAGRWTGRKSLFSARSRRERGRRSQNPLQTMNGIPKTIPKIFGICLITKACSLSTAHMCLSECVTVRIDNQQRLDAYRKPYS